MLCVICLRAPIDGFRTICARCNEPPPSVTPALRKAYEFYLAHKVSGSMPVWRGKLPSPGYPGKVAPPVPPPMPAGTYTTITTTILPPDPRSAGIGRAVERLNAGSEYRLGSARWAP